MDLIKEFSEGYVYEDDEWEETFPNVEDAEQIGTHKSSEL